MKCNICDFCDRIAVQNMSFLGEKCRFYKLCGVIGVFHLEGIEYDTKR